MHDQVKQSLQQRLAAFETLCREKGLKLTHQRLEIYRELLTAVDHPSVDDLFQRVRKNIPTISLDTVYRTLAMLEEAGMIKRIQTAEGHARFEPDYGVHHHLVCRRCQKIEDFHWKEFDAMAMPPELKDWGEIKTRNIQIEGICSACLAQEK
ncbi:MAG: transcriptional repressor [Thermodesulfobacteriota bacterium]